MGSCRNYLPPISRPKETLKADNQIKCNIFGFRLCFIKSSRWSRIDEKTNSDHFEITLTGLTDWSETKKISLQKLNLASALFGLLDIASGSNLASKLVDQKFRKKYMGSLPN